MVNVFGGRIFEGWGHGVSFLVEEAGSGGVLREVFVVKTTDEGVVEQSGLSFRNDFGDRKLSIGDARQSKRERFQHHKSKRVGVHRIHKDVGILVCLLEALVRHSSEEIDLGMVAKPFFDVLGEEREHGEVHVVVFGDLFEGEQRFVPPLGVKSGADEEQLNGFSVLFLFFTEGVLGLLYRIGHLDFVLEFFAIQPVEEAFLGRFGPWQQQSTMIGLKSFFKHTPRPFALKNFTTVPSKNGHIFKIDHPRPMVEQHGLRAVDEICFFWDLDVFEIGQAQPNERIFRMELELSLELFQTFLFGFADVFFDRFS